MNSFWSVIGVVIVTFVFVAYLLLFFRILVDLFSDHDLSGWLRAGWIIALVAVPFVTALVYVVARGQAMAERQLVADRAKQERTDAYLLNIGHSPEEDIAHSKELLDGGVITRTEFERLKAEALA